MSPVSLDIIKYKTIEPLTRVVFYVLVYLVFTFVLRSLDIAISEWPPILMLIVVWFIIEYAMQSEATEYYVLPEYEGHIRQVLETEGMKLKSQDDHRALYDKPSRFTRPLFVVIRHKDTYFTIKGSTDFSPKLKPHISDDMLYGKRKGLALSRPNQSK